MPTKALVVDDSPVTRRIVSIVLNSQNIPCKEALNGREALEILNWDPSFGLVMVDWNMPEMNGMDFLAEVKRQPKFEHIKIIIVTANDTPEAIEEAQKAGADDFIIKPVYRDVVAKKLQLHGLN
ncbi:response regulator [Pelagicoccus mobilis]|uniref:Response regulator n=1 Tax=Pelagicoccus mobilis TaxID=415221 RepID=A0A934S3A9_9BACT|nr:response regulator [Pelagicoccus mobilis]MBK1878268.1 response regulator [Pelagicoccus mobilis]